MSTATICRLRSGGASVELDGVTVIAPDWRTAADDADARGIAWVLTEAPHSPSKAPASP